jgi:hypothetical protein
MLVLYNQQQELLPLISLQMFCRVLTLSCRTGKACGDDNVCYEHLILPNDILSPKIADILSYIHRLLYKPDEMEKSSIKTLHKSGKMIPIIIGQFSNIFSPTLMDDMVLVPHTKHRLF